MNKAVQSFCNGKALRKNKSLKYTFSTKWDGTLEVTGMSLKASFSIKITFFHSAAIC